MKTFDRKTMLVAETNFDESLGYSVNCGLCECCDIDDCGRCPFENKESFNVFLKQRIEDKIKEILVKAGNTQLNLQCESVVEKLTNEIMEVVK